MVAFQTYRRNLVAVSEFKCLGRVMTALDDDWMAVVGNVRKSRKRWAHMSRILGREGEDPWNSGKFYKAVLQEKLLLGAES